MTVDNRAPAAPVLVSATLAGTDISVSWQANPEPDLAGYLLYNNDVLANVRRIVNGSTTPYLLTATSFLDKTLPDGRHKYTVFALDKAGNISDASNALTVEIETRAPRATIIAPSNGSSTEHRVTLVAATPDQDVARVQFQFKAAAATEWIDVGAPAALAPYEAGWDPAGLPYGDYQLRAVATDTNGNVDPTPAFITITLRDLTAPPAPASLTARVNGADVTLSWAAVGAEDLNGYAVFRAAGPAAAVQLTTVSGGTTTFINAGAGDGSYVYTVRALDPAGNKSEPSPPAGAHIYAPTMLAPAVCVSQDITGLTGAGAEPNSTVHLFADTGSGPVLVRTGQTAADGTFGFAAIPLVPGVTVFTASVTDAVTNVSRLSQPVSITRSDVPGAPTGFTAVVNGFDVSLTWDQHPAVNGYVLTRNGALLNTLNDVATGGSPSASSSNWWGVREWRAIDRDEFSYWTPHSDDQAPWWKVSFNAPVLISRIDIQWGHDDGYAPGYATDFDVQQWDGQAWITIEKVRDNTESDNSIIPRGSLVSSQIRITNLVRNDNQEVQLAEVRVLSRADISGTTFPVSGLSDGRYTYRLSALNACAVEGPAAAVVVAVGDVTPPAPPIALTAAVADASVTLAWTAGTEPDLAGYNVYRNAGDGLWARRNAVLLQSTTLIDNGVANGNYLYRVTAVDALGNESDPSNEAAAVVAVTPPGAVAELHRHSACGRRSPRSGVAGRIRHRRRLQRSSVARGRWSVRTAHAGADRRARLPRPPAD